MNIEIGSLCLIIGLFSLIVALGLSNINDRLKEIATQLKYFNNENNK